MDIGISIRNMGSPSSREVVAGAALAVETLGFESIWITDHIAIPPDDAEGSGGRYLDTLTTLAWLAGLTTQIKLGSGVLILPAAAATLAAGIGGHVVALMTEPLDGAVIGAWGADAGVVLNGAVVEEDIAAAVGQLVQ